MTDCLVQPLMGLVCEAFGLTIPLSMRPSFISALSDSKVAASRRPCVGTELPLGLVEVDMILYVHQNCERQLVASK